MVAGWLRRSLPVNGTRFRRLMSGGPVSYVNDRRNIHFMLYQVLKLDKTLAAHYPEHSVSSIDDIFTTVERVAVDHFLPHNMLSDKHEALYDAANETSVIIPDVKKGLDAYYSTGLGGSNFPSEVGGLNLPPVVHFALLMPLYAANCSTCSYPLLTSAAANLMLHHCDAKQIDKYVPKMVAGKFFGTMNLSEPQAGSSLADIATKAIRMQGENPAEIYSISGSKMWITGAEHNMSENIINLVLAKTGDGSEGVKSISLFIVPKFLVNDDGSLGRRNDIKLVGVNHKMGFRGAVNTVLKYGDEGECVGYLIGKEGHGLKYMFHMMNEARVAVGLLATALGYAGYAYSLQYARDRKQGRHVNTKDPSKPQIPIIQHSDVKRMLLAQKCYVEGSLALVLYTATLLDKIKFAESDTQRSELTLFLDLLTPLVKSYPSEWALEANKWAIQILGGYGYTRDYPVEQFYRDNRLNMVHEGTNGIQSIDLVGRKITSKVAIDQLTSEIKKCINEARKVDITRHLPPGETYLILEEYASGLEDALKAFVKCVDVLNKENNAALKLSNSHEMLNMSGRVVVGWMWLLQANEAARELIAMKAPGYTQSSQGVSPEFLNGKLVSARWYLVNEVTKVASAAAVIQRMDHTNLLMSEDFF